MFCNSLICYIIYCRNNLQFTLIISIPVSLGFRAATELHRGEKFRAAAHFGESEGTSKNHSFSRVYRYMTRSVFIMFLLFCIWDQLYSCIGAIFFFSSKEHLCNRSVLLEKNCNDAQ